MERFLYVQNNPINLLDPSGLVPILPSLLVPLVYVIRFRPFCGPDVTDWFIEEMRVHLNFSKQMFSKYGPTNIFNFGTNDRATNKSLAFMTYASTLLYKKMPFRGCFCPQDCKQSVTLCGKCIDNSELGNLAYGATGGIWGFEYLTLFNAAFLAAYGNALRHPWDRAGALAGFKISTQLFRNPERLCELLTQTKNWDDIQQPSVVKCTICKLEKYQGKHSAPGIPNVFPGVDAAEYGRPFRK
jgi:hypothetical protein